MSTKKPHNVRELIRYFAKNLTIVIGIVLIWRSVWYVLDGIDIHFFDKNKTFTVVGGFIVGLLLLYLPDKDLKEIQKL